EAILRLVRLTRSRADVGRCAARIGVPVVRIVPEIVLRVTRQVLIDVVMHVIEVAADSEIVNAGHRHRRKVEVVAQLDAALTEFLRGAGPAEAAATFEVETDEVRTEDRLIPTILLEAERGFVQCAAVVPLMVKRSLVNP